VWMAVQKYGLSNFAFVVIESVPSIVNVEDNTQLLNREDYYISTLKPKYNIAQQAGNTFGVKHADETKIAMRLNYSSERRERIGALNRGKKLSPDTIEAIRLAALKRAPMSEETRNKVSANSAKAQLYLVSRLDNNLFMSTKGIMVSEDIIRTLPVVAAFLGCDEKTVRRALHKDGIIKKLWVVRLYGKSNYS
jgi:group I intron endonuclease